MATYSVMERTECLASLLPMATWTAPCLTSLNMLMASWWVRPATDRPFTENISSPENKLCLECCTLLASIFFRHKIIFTFNRWTTKFQQQKTCRPQNTELLSQKSRLKIEHCHILCSKIYTILWIQKRIFSCDQIKIRIKISFKVSLNLSWVRRYLLWVARRPARWGRHSWRRCRWTPCWSPCHPPRWSPDSCGPVPSGTSRSVSGTAGSFFGVAACRTLFHQRPEYEHWYTLIGELALTNSRLFLQMTLICWCK